MIKNLSSRIGTPAGVALLAALMLPRPYCLPAEPHVQLFANPPITPANLFAWRKSDPSIEVLLTRTGMSAQCYAVTRSAVNQSNKIQWEDGLCFRLESPDGSINVEGCN